jgi:DNA-binding response OmpR family regulator
MAEANKKILIVEDEQVLSKALTERFTNEGYQILTASDGELGLQMALKEEPDLILLDIVLPKLDGMAMMRQLREGSVWGKQVPVILLTNLNVDDNMMDAITKDKPAYYLVKTDWTMDQIAEKVKERLDRVSADAKAEEVTKV